MLWIVVGDLCIPSAVNESAPTYMLHLTNDPSQHLGTCRKSKVSFLGEGEPDRRDCWTHLCLGGARPTSLELALLALIDVKESRRVT